MTSPLWKNEGWQSFLWQLTKHHLEKLHTHTHTHAHTESINTTTSGICTKTQLFNFINIDFFLFHQQVFFLNSSSLSTNRKQTVYNRSNPYSTKHSQGKNEHFRFSSPSSTPRRRGRSWASACAGAARWAPHAERGMLLLWSVGREFVLFLLVQKDDQLSMLLW